jgi:predicted ABC-type ATPase
VSTPVLHVLAGPNGSGKSTLAVRRLIPATHLPFVNADDLAAATWPGDEASHTREAQQLAVEERSRLMAARASFITETVFSHRSKIDLVREATALGYLVHLHILLVPEEATVKRVEFRVRQGGHSVPADKIRSRYARLWELVAEARTLAAQTTIYDNSKADKALQVVARYEYGIPTSEPAWPEWTPAVLR